MKSPLDSFRLTASALAITLALSPMAMAQQPAPGPANPAPPRANLRQTSSCSAPSTWTDQAGAAAKMAWRLDARAGHHSTSGGSSETLEKLFTVIPIGPDGPSAVTTVTPVAKQPRASRRVRGSEPA